MDFIDDAVNGITRLFNGDKSDIEPGIDDLMMDKMLEGVTVGDLAEAINSDQPNIKIGELEIPCNLAEQLKENIDKVPLADVMEMAAKTGHITNVVQAIQVHSEMSQRIDDVCSVDEIGRELTPPPTQIEQDKPQTLGV